MIGPWTLNVQGQKIPFMALTMIDTVTNLVELVRVDNKEAAHIAMHFVNSWLSRYPRPLYVIHDQGGEFIGFPFQNMLIQNGITSRPITSKNPTANSICERMHQSIGNTLRVLASMDPPQGNQTANQLVDTALTTAVFVSQSTLSSALSITPDGIAFGHDMVMNIPLITDLELLRQKRQQLVNQRLIEANRKRFSYDYNVGDEVLKLIHKPDKLEERAIGPFPITCVHANGTVTIRLSPTVVERLSLRRIKPYHW